jgi:hypothetical protein
MSLEIKTERFNKLKNMYQNKATNNDFNKYMDKLEENGYDVKGLIENAIKQKIRKQIGEKTETDDYDMLMDIIGDDTTLPPPDSFGINKTGGKSRKTRKTKKTKKSRKTKKTKKTRKSRKSRRTKK